MLCCAVGIAAVATGAIGWRRFRRFLPGPLKAQSLLAAGAAAAVVLTISAVSVQHLRHHVAHASDQEPALSDPLPLCSGTDRITNTASSKE
jgi:hypothetical protein